MAWNCCYVGDGTGEGVGGEPALERCGRVHIEAFTSSSPPPSKGTIKTSGIAVSSASGSCAGDQGLGRPHMAERLGVVGMVTGLLWHWLGRWVDIA